jgi:hypothetical protein
MHIVLYSCKENLYVMVSVRIPYGQASPNMEWSIYFYI